MSFRKSEFSTSQWVLCNFRNIFNHPECAAQCEYVEQNGTWSQVCTTLIGYDDLLYKLDENRTALLQSGEFWELSCSTKLTGEISAEAVVQDDGDQQTIKVVNGAEIDFSLNLMCCESDETDCKKCDRPGEYIPIIKIGPKSKADSSKVVSYLCPYGR